MWVIAVSIYSKLSSKISPGRVTHTGALLRKSIISLNANANNSIEIGKGSIFEHCRIVISGQNCKVIIRDDCVFKYLHLIITGDNAICEIGRNVTINAYSRSLTKFNIGESTKVIIGDDTLFSNGVGMYTTDFHKIFDAEGKQMNPNKNIEIGKHVWVGLETIILKGSRISNGTVIGAGSLVTGLLDENSVYVGRPVKKLATGITWEK